LFLKEMNTFIHQKWQQRH